MIIFLQAGETPNRQMGKEPDQLATLGSHGCKRLRRLYLATDGARDALETDAYAIKCTDTPENGGLIR